MNIASIDMLIKILTNQKSLLARADELTTYLENVDTLEIAVSIPPTTSTSCRRYSSEECMLDHHDVLPESAQEILRTYMSEALQTAIHDLHDKAANIHEETP